ncbi:MAG: Rieske (2Fe-2S) protein [Pseudomonadota bacterium]
MNKITMSENSHWRTVANYSDFPSSGLMDVLIGRKVILLVKKDATVLALQGLCPHQQARLAEGVVQDDKLQCPHHLAAFNLSDGSCTGGWQLPPLKRYIVEVDGDDILLHDPLQEVS